MIITANMLHNSIKNIIFVIQIIKTLDLLVKNKLQI